MDKLYFLVIIVFVVGFIGWIINIVDICQSNFDHITGLLIVRCIGVFVAPIGAILGFF